MRTKIVCTIGPASENKNTLKAMIKAGMNVARLTFAHGNYKSHEVVIKNVRDISENLDIPVAIMQDLQGPKIRVGELPKGGVELKARERILIINKSQIPNYKQITNSKLQTEIKKIPVQYKNLYKDIKKNDTILLDDGLIELEVLSVKENDIECEVVDGGTLTSNKGLNVPTASVSIYAITEKDKKDLEFGIKQDVDFVAMSFVKTAEDILNLRELIKKYEKKYKKSNTKIIAKIEKHEAIKNFDEILRATDGVMVARGDLGLETPIEKVPIAQKMIISKCLEAAKPVIVATQMLNSMIKEPRPTRAEVSDVANAVIDHTDAVMLSAESAVGKYPVESVKMMRNIINKTEESPYDDLILKDKFRKTKDKDIAISLAAYNMMQNMGAKSILIMENSERIGSLISRYRPEVPIVIIADSKKIQRQLVLSWGIVPFVLPRYKEAGKLVEKSIEYILERGLVKKKDKIVIVGGQHTGKSRRVDLVKL